MAENAHYAYIDRFQAKNFFSIDDIEMTGLGSRREVYLLGENGYGKSLILMAMVLAIRGRFIENETAFKETGPIIDLIRANESLHLECADSEKQGYSLKNNSNSNGGSASQSNLRNVLAYGVHRSRNDSERSSQYDFLSLFDENQTLRSPEQWLQNLYTKKLENETRGSVLQFEPASFEAAQQILKDILDKNVEIEVSSEGVKYIERGTALKFSQLSEGYKSVLVWVCDMVSRLSAGDREVSKIQDCRGIVLVDEINLHLHPKWEKQLARKLRGWFPNVQFIFTTHSPVTILGASEDAVFYRVFKESGKTCLSEPFFKKDLKNLTANTVLTSPLFGLGDARMFNGEAASMPSLDTSDDFLYSRIHRKIAERVEQKKANGKAFFSEAEIDALIEQALLEETAA